MSGNEAVSSEIVASAHIENYAMKLFEWADKEDRAARIGKNVVKSFYTAGNLFDIMQVRVINLGRDTFGNPIFQKVLQN